MQRTQVSYFLLQTRYPQKPSERWQKEKVSELTPQLTRPLWPGHDDGRIRFSRAGQKMPVQMDWAAFYGYSNEKPVERTMEAPFSIIDRAASAGRGDTRGTGSEGEKLAAGLLEKNGYLLVMANFKAPIGRNRNGAQVTGEIDLIALDGETLCFVEVKTRSSRDFGGPLTAVDNQKQRQITRTARVYRRIFGVFDVPHRFDVVTVVLSAKGTPEIELIRGFWTEAKFRKQSWTSDNAGYGY